MIWYRCSAADRSTLKASRWPVVPTSVKSNSALLGSLANRSASNVLLAASPSLSVSVALNANLMSLAKLSLSLMNSITGILMSPRAIVSCTASISAVPAFWTRKDT
ncbi:hypothetical protein D3C76_1556650 [compost metagenome]